MRGREAARRAGVSPTAMRMWIGLYKMDGPAAFASSNAKRTYSEEIKKKVVKDYLTGKGSFQTLCEKYHLRSPELVNRWVKSYNGHKDSKKISGGFFMTKRKSAIDERLAAVKEYTEAGKPYEQIARERGFSYRQVSMSGYGNTVNSGLQVWRTGVESEKSLKHLVPRKKNLKSVSQNWNMKTIC